MQVAFEILKKACLDAPVLVFANFPKPFLLKTNASKLGLGVMLSQKQSDGKFYPVAYASQSLTIHECKLSFYQAGVSGFEVDNCQAGPGISALETLL